MAKHVSEIKKECMIDAVKQLIDEGHRVSMYNVFEIINKDPRW